MSAERFTIDTNILIYAGDFREVAKQPLAAAIVRAAIGRDCRITIQAVMEFYAAARRRLAMTAAAAAIEARRHLTLFATIGPSHSATLRALDAAEAGLFSHWDALLLATADEAGCTAALSEDMHDGARFGNLVVRHPFVGSKLSEAAKQLLEL